MEWWTGGFTAREPFLKAIEETGAKPWDLIREHQYALCPLPSALCPLQAAAA